MYLRDTCHVQGHGEGRGVCAHRFTGWWEGQRGARCPNLVLNVLTNHGRCYREEQEESLKEKNKRIASRLRLL